jgi:hypothetical protein
LQQANCLINNQTVTNTVHSTLRDATTPYTDPCSKVKMKHRILIQFLLSTIIQLICYVGILYLAKVTLDFTTNDKYILMSDYGIQLSTVIFTMIISVQNLLTALINRKWFTWIGILIVLIIYSIGWGEDFSSWPERTIIYLIIGFYIILGKIQLDSTLKKLTKQKLQPIE